MPLHSLETAEVVRYSHSIENRKEKQSPRALIWPINPENRVSDSTDVGVWGANFGVSPKTKTKVKNGLFMVHTSISISWMSKNTFLCAPYIATLSDSHKLTLSQLTIHNKEIRIYIYIYILQLKTVY